MKTIFISHPIGGNVSANLSDLFRILRILNMQHPDTCFIAPYVADVMALDDSIPEQRARGIKNGTWLLHTMHIDEFWLCGPFISPGMEAERLIAVEEGIVVKDKIGMI